MHATQTFAQLLVLASMAAGLPQPVREEHNTAARDIEKRAGFNPRARCEEHRPAEDELMWMSYVGHNLEFDPEGGITSANGDRFGFLLDSSCSRVVMFAEYEAAGVNNGWKAITGMSYDGTGPELGWQVTVEAHVKTMGAALGIAGPTIKINGEEKSKSCTLKNRNEGLGVDYYQMCNFKPGSVWPRPWWPNFSGFN
ncbi:hypothetical protein CMUS01_11461 [Colletotrichum musicola]|uniref:Ecp2 effector protein domain-containing protein n=1 Tax=Colletotrichum musicola TaxID=2175873 RepID=A0A8H6N648_9PEZI|nr:hypothetical protein CMUS01_11461 [Colletotrichum musicola]